MNYLLLFFRQTSRVRIISCGLWERTSSINTLIHGSDRWISSSIMWIKLVHSWKYWCHFASSAPFMISALIEVLIWILVGWACQCAILNAINIHRCQVCSKWILANQDRWLLSVSSNLRNSNSLAGADSFSFLLTSKALTMLIYQICRHCECLLDWIFHEQASHQRIC